MKLDRLEPRVAWLAGSAVALAGIAVMAGWHMHWDKVIQIVPGLVPMQFNTALNFFMAALALLAAEARRPRLSMAAAAFVFVFAALTGLQYVANADFGIDTLLFDPYLQTRTAHPGRMAPNTTLCFMLYSLCFVYWHRSGRPEISFNLMAFCSITLVLVGLIVLGGYAAKVEAAYSWWGISDMAPQTATLLVVLGVGVLTHARIIGRRQEEGAKLRLWMPAYVALGGIILTLLIAQGILLYQKDNTYGMAAQEARRFTSMIDVELRRLVLGGLGRMAERIDFAHGVAEEAAWRNDAANYVRDHANYETLALMDGNCAVRYAMPEETSGKDLLRDHCRDEGVASIVRPSGQQALLLLHLPLKHGAGYVAAVYRLEETLQKMIPDSARSFSYKLSGKNGETIFATGRAQGEQMGWGSTASETLSIGGMAWKIEVTADVASFRENALAFAVVLFGITLSLLLGNTLYQVSKTRALRRRLETMVDQMADGVILVDERKRITSYNHACETIFGYTLPEMMGQPTDKLLPAEQAGLFTIPSTGREIEARHKNGAVFPLEFSVGEVKIGTERLFSVLLRDISLRKTKELELKRSNVELEQFAYVASHDLKAPLRGIDNLAHWIAEDLGDHMTDTAREQFELLHKRVARLETLLEDILRYSRAGRIVDAPERIDVRELLGQITIPLTVDGKFEVNIEQDMPALMTHRTPLEQVFTNIINNAMRHHDRDKGVLAVGWQRSGRFCEFFVQDDGPGIPRQFHDKAYQMFQTLQPRDKREGSGLGMAIVKKLVEWQGGRTWIESPVEGGRGTRIHFLWPLQS